MHSKLKVRLAYCVVDKFLGVEIVDRSQRVRILRVIVIAYVLNLKIELLEHRFAYFVVFKVITSFQKGYRSGGQAVDLVELPFNERNVSILIEDVLTGAEQLHWPFEDLKFVVHLDVEPFQACLVKDFLEKIF